MAMDPARGPRISEVENTDIDIKPVKFKNDSVEKQLPKPLSMNQFYIFSAPPGRGKTTLVLNLINRKNKCYWGLFDRVEIFSPSIQTAGQKINIDPKRIHSTLDLAVLSQIIESERKSDHRLLIVLDDVVSTMAKNIKPMIDLVFNRRHIGGGVSLWITCQAYNKVPLELRKACSGLFVWKTTNKKEIKSIYEDFSSLEFEDFLAVLRFCWQDEHDFMFLDTQHDIYHRNFNELRVTAS